MWRGRQNSQEGNRQKEGEGSLVPSSTYTNIELLSLHCSVLVQFLSSVLSSFRVNRGHSYSGSLIYVSGVSHVFCFLIFYGDCFLFFYSLHTYCNRFLGDCFWEFDLFFNYFYSVWNGIRKLSGASDVIFSPTDHVKRY